MGEIKPGFDHWRKSGEYLPEFMRDFHDQKELFKALQEVVERRNAKDSLSYTKDVDWIAAHVYTVDVFLWIMAGHGYTLQRSRRKFQFGDIYEFVSASTKRWRDSAASAFGLRAALTQEPK